MTDPRRRIPGVDRLLAEAGALVDRHGHDETVRALREVLEVGRDEIARGAWPADPELSGPWLERAGARLRDRALPSLRRVLNATGVVLHTNLGRARLAEVAVRAAAEAGAGYTNLEFDLESGARGSRYDHARRLLTELTGAEDALVVNNCAAGLLLAVSALARGREVVVSRGELVEIGGGFRIPEVMERAGATLREVGTTNRTRAADFDRAAESIRTGALLQIHRSNFRIDGFTETATLAELVEIGGRRHLPVVHDLGSGLLVDPEELGLPAEPTPSGSIAEGVDLVIFSGDKLLGGPQAGIVVGGARWIEKMRRDPFCRAFRVDKGTLAALEATLRLLREPARALVEIPTLAALRRTRGELTEVAHRLTARIRAEAPAGVELSVVEVEGRVGGGTFPEHPLPSAALRISPVEGSTGSPEGWAARARTVAPPEIPVVGRVEAGGWLLDPRCLIPDEEEALATTVLAALRPDRGAAG